MMSRRCASICCCLAVSAASLPSSALNATSNSSVELGLAADVVGVFYKNGWYKCLDLPGGNTVNGNKLQVWDCNGHDNQKWIFAPGSWNLVYASDPRKCVDVPGGDFNNGNQLQIWDCNGRPGQIWGYDSNMGTIYLAKSASDASKCMDLAGGNSNNGGKVEVWDCNGLSNQQWSFSPPSPSPGPSPPSAGGKAGIALHLEHSSQQDRNAVAGSRISWYYNWGMSGPTQQGLDYIPMMWGSGNANSCGSVQKSWALLGFNEPNMDHSKGGSGMSVDQVVQLWPQVEKCAQDKGVQTLVGPAVANVHPSQWYDEFFSKCHGCRVDAIAIHSYSCDTNGMKNYINTFKKYGKPLWLTEFACADNPKGIPGNNQGSKAWNWQCQYMKNVIPFLMNEPSVAKFAWFSSNSGYTGESNLVSGGQLTQLGGCYNNLVGGGLKDLMLV